MPKRILRPASPAAVACSRPFHAGAATPSTRAPNAETWRMAPILSSMWPFSFGPAALALNVFTEDARGVLDGASLWPSCETHWKHAAPNPGVWRQHCFARSYFPLERQWQFPCIRLQGAPSHTSTGAGEVTTFCYALINKISSALFCLLSLLFLHQLFSLPPTSFFPSSLQIAHPQQHNSISEHHVTKYSLHTQSLFYKEPPPPPWFPS